MDFFILSICKGNEFPLSQSKENLRPTLGDLFFTFGDPAFPTQATVLADAVGGFFNDLKKTFVILSGVGVVDLAKELIG